MIVFAGTDKGCIRQNNEDTFYTAPSGLGSFDAVLLVADGMGGHMCGEVASATCAEVMARTIQEISDDSAEFVFSEAMSAANLAVLKEAERLHALGMGTTVVCAGIRDDHVFAANLGDSRLYVINTENKTISQITRDHSLVEEQVRRGLIKRNSAEYNAQKNVITRAIGIYLEVDPDFFEFEITERDILLLCSDGLSNLVDDNEIRDIICECGCCKETVDILIEKAKEYGGGDNITVCLGMKEVKE